MKINRITNTVKVKNPVVIVEMSNEGVLQFAWFGNDRSDGSPPPLEIMAIVIAGVVNTGAALLDIDATGLLNAVKSAIEEPECAVHRIRGPRP